MKTLFYKTLPVSNINLALLIIRVGAALLMLTHGGPKLMQLFSGEPITFASVMGMSATVSLALAAFAEGICSAFVFFGFLTRLATIPIIITMSVAALHIHSDDPFAQKEKALLFLLIFVFLLLTGGGKYSIDNILSRNQGKKQLRY